jgi:AraC family transcriptional regulator
MGILHQRPKSFRGNFKLNTLFSLNQYGEDVTASFGGHSTPNQCNPLDIVLMAPGTQRHLYFPNGGSHAVIHFHSPIKFEKIHQPIILQTGRSGRPLQKQIERIISLGSNPRVHALLWNLLWDLEELGVSQHGVHHTEEHQAFQKATATLYRDFGQHLQIREVVEASGVSHNRLTTIFRERCGETIVAHLRRIRVDAAERMLRYSDQSIKSIAIDVGLPNLQRFNKVFRQQTGISPRAYRESLPR